VAGALSAAERAVADAHRREWAFVLAATVRVTRDLDLAEECVQEAYVSALGAWTRDGVPARTGAWLTVAARRTALNALRRAQTLQAKLPLLLAPEADDMPELDEDAIPDDRLRLVFTCCHPALSQEAQVALTLRLVCGVATGDIAQAFLVAEPTMAARLTRAKRKIATARIPYAVPGPADLPARVDAVLTVIHLLATTGHTAPSGDALMREDLLARALDLARMLTMLMPAEREAQGLLALLLVHHARRGARTDDQGRLVLLADQDRSAWDRGAIEDADRLLVAALRAGLPGRFTLQAAIAALHAQAPSWEETDWPQIVTLYGRLLEVWPSPVVALNRAIAVSMADGPGAALAEVEALERDERLAGYRYLPAAKADMLRRLGRRDAAAEAYRAALALTGNAAERAFLEARLGELGSGT
jgi:RNA polymerase sigma-70 factor, ECF subfamily